MTIPAIYENGVFRPTEQSARLLFGRGGDSPSESGPGNVDRLKRSPDLGPVAYPIEMDDMESATGPGSPGAGSRSRIPHRDG
jgi:hypothetical protein